MHTRKNHHYIPQFYLRYFSIGRNNKTIGVYNYNNQRFILNASIKHQACEKFLYGDDDIIESELGKFEFYSSKVFDRLIKVQVLPPLNSVYFILIKKYIIYQSMRTIKAGDEIHQRLDAGFSEVFKLTSFYEGKFKDLVLRYKDPVIISLSMVEKGLPLLNFLNCKLLINSTKLPFITSDNPVAFYNQFAELKKASGGTGWAVKGLQIFFPLNPSLLLMLYDPLVYKCGKKKEASIYLQNEKDVDQLNALQYLSGRSQLFFSDCIRETYLQTLPKRFKNIKSKSGFVSYTEELETYHNGDKRVQIINTSKDSFINLNLSFIKLTKPAKKVDLPNNTSCLRHESFYKLQMRDNLIDE